MRFHLLFGLSKTYPSCNLTAHWHRTCGLLVNNDDDALHCTAGFGHNK